MIPKSIFCVILIREKYSKKRLEKIYPQINCDAIRGGFVCGEGGVGFFILFSI